MQLFHFKIRFLEYLQKEYPVREVESFFNLLTEAYLGMSRLEVALKPEKKLSVSEEEKFEKALNRLIKHEPIQYIIGETEFFGLLFKVNKNVLIPRPETEELVQWILDDYKNPEETEIKILDIGTGSGCIAISLAKNLPRAKVTAMDISEKALKIAKENAVLNHVEIEFLQQDVLKAEKLPTSYDIIVSNPPYVRELEKAGIQPNVLNNEPAQALFVKDNNPLLFYEKIVSLAKNALNMDGNLYFEINQYLGLETTKIIEKQGFESELRKDIFGNSRMLKAKILHAKNGKGN